jgi:2-dehydropantoate 2-reductase
MGGSDVTLVARGPHLAALRRDGLRLVSPTGVDVLLVHAVDGPGALGEPQFPERAVNLNSRKSCARLG